MTGGSVARPRLAEDVMNSYPTGIRRLSVVPRGARDNQDYSRSYYNYRERQNYENRSYGRGIFTSGW